MEEHKSKGAFKPGTSATRLRQVKRDSHRKVSKSALRLLGHYPVMHPESVIEVSNQPSNTGKGRAPGAKGSSVFNICKIKTGEGT